MTVRPERLDIAMVERGIAETRSRAQAMIMAGDVRVDGTRVDRAGQRVGPQQVITLKERKRFVSRGGEKLQHALDAFELPAADLVCADIGASTGGFTDCLLHAGARTIYAIDVGYGQLDMRLRDDPRVIVMERINARYLQDLPEPIDLVTIDVSFISLGLIFPVVHRILKLGGHGVALVKPQFEAGRGEIGKKGVVSDPQVHRSVLLKTIQAAADNALNPIGLVRSPLRGPEGNIEFLLHLVKGDGPTSIGVETVEQVLGDADESFTI